MELDKFEMDRSITRTKYMKQVVLTLECWEVSGDRV